MLPEQHYHDWEGSSMDHGGDTEPHREDLGEVIENVIQAESSLLAAQAVMLDSSLTHRPGYESIVEHLSVALGRRRPRWPSFTTSCMSCRPLLEA